MEKFSSIDKIRFAREAGAVRRFHTRVIIGNYTVAEHSFNMLCLLKILHPNPSSNLIWACHSHDLPERWIGDMPAPAKWIGVLDKDWTDILEEKILHHTGFSYGELTEEEKGWLHGLDMLEFFIFLRTQWAIGNRDLQDHWDKVTKWMEEHAVTFPQEIITFFDDIRTAPWDPVRELIDYPWIWS